MTPYRPATARWGYAALALLASACVATPTGPATTRPPIVVGITIPPPTEPPIASGIGVVDGNIRVWVRQQDDSPGLAEGFRSYWEDVNATLGGVSGFPIELVDDPAGGVLVIGPSWKVAELATSDGPSPASEYPDALVAGPVRLADLEDTLIVASPTRPSIEAQAALAFELTGGETSLIHADGVLGEACRAQGGWRSETAISELSIEGVELGEWPSVFCWEVNSWQGADETRFGVDVQVVALEPAYLLSATLPPSMIRIGGCPDPDSPGLALARSVLGAEASPAMLEGYLQAATLHVVLERAVANGDLTHDGLRAAITDPTVVDLGFGTEPATLVGDGPPARVCDA